MFFEQTFTIYHDCGKLEFVEDLVAYIYKFGGSTKFLEHMKYNVREFNVRKKRGIDNYYSTWYGYMPKFFVCTASGLMVSPELVYGEFVNHYMATQGEYYEYRQKVRRHRYGQQTKHTYTSYKRMGTHPARRSAAGVVKEEGEPKFRGKRDLHYIPTFWDDIRSRHSCSWKNSTTRKKQYKGS